ncbi:hypothetical protein [Dictyobacter kobayashii]|uniref:Major facilitator superfamily (MFS) profile domain-containing protein n=1 Tax=Dictyobacter kobayashii TaxID=2014872 RepID=A0A402AJS3_9CHLR|nr:hypothetical protein [Dictyobacter kobayashii]GCE19352.1 hypothetical protein KDK_31520 [Dictyobacter kobayashii]
MSNSEKHYPTSRPDSVASDADYIDEREYVEAPSLPPNGLTVALGVGCVGGVLAALLSIATTLFNASAFQEVARLGDKISYGTAQYIAGLTCLTYTVTLILAFVAGYVVGKRAVRRLYGFYAGALVGAISYLGSSLVQYIPNYPGHISSSAVSASALSGTLVLLLFALIWAVVGALIGLWGAFTTTKRHPYYLAKQAQVEE